MVDGRQINFEGLAFADKDNFETKYVGSCHSPALSTLSTE